MNSNLPGNLPIWSYIKSYKINSASKVEYSGSGNQNYWENNSEVIKGSTVYEV